MNSKTNILNLSQVYREGRRVVPSHEEPLLGKHDACSIVVELQQRSGCWGRRNGQSVRTGSDCGVFDFFACWKLLICNGWGSCAVQFMSFLYFLFVFFNFLDLLSNRVMHNQIQSRHRFVRHLRLVEVVGVLLYPYKR